MRTAFSPAAEATPARGERGMPDPWLLLPVLLLVAGGLVMVYSASAVKAGAELHDPFHFLERQLVAALVGLLALLAGLRLGARGAEKLATAALGLAVLSLLLALVPGIGVAAGGARRWIGLGPFHFQPAELAKVALVLYLARSLARKQSQVRVFSIGFLPHLLVLSTSSPFVEGEDTGLKCYRLAAYNELPRTGLPERFGSWAEYRHTVDLLVRNGVIEDATKIWWDLRPSARFPTLELRVPDVCTLRDDAVCVAALYVSILRMLYRIRRSNQMWRPYPRFLLSENRWRAQRYGVAGTLFDFGKGELVPFGNLIDELLDMVREDAEALGCWPEAEHARTIVARGTSADRQVACFNRLLAEGATRDAALRGVVEHLIEETIL